MVERLQNELSSLRGKLRHNEMVWAGFRDLQVRLISAASPAEIVAILANDLPRIFPRITAVSLTYLDSDRELSRLLRDHRSHFIELSAEQLHAFFPPPHRPRLGPCSDSALTHFFPGVTPGGSAALVPLILRGRLVGSLNQLSRESGHFITSDGTDLLEHLAAVLAMCIENALGRERLKKEGLTDPLTGVANRRMFDGRLSEEMERCARRAEPLACLLADIDYFKVINDRFGHAVGDDVLRAVAAAIAGELRATDVFARYGGEEFVLLLPGTNQTQARAIAERVRAAVEALKFTELMRERRVSISIGVACLHAADVREGAGDELVRRADGALYEAKATGRNCVRFIDTVA